MRYDGDRARKKMLEAYDRANRRYTERAQQRVLEAYEAFDVDEFCQVSGLSRHSYRTMMCEARHGRPFGLQHIERAASVLGLNIAEMFLFSDDEIMNNYEYYEGAEISYYSANIRRLMEEKGINAYTLAKKVGANYMTICDYLKGRSKFPRIQILEKVANALGTELPELFLPPKDGGAHD